MNVVVATRAKQSDVQGESSTTVSPGLTVSKSPRAEETESRKERDGKWREVRKGMSQAELFMSA